MHIAYYAHYVFAAARIFRGENNKWVSNKQS